ncbi:hypothetical protein MDAP_000752 [Mitosporidium daphniae]
MSQTPSTGADSTVFERLTNIELISRDENTNTFIYNGAEVESHFGARGIYGGLVASQALVAAIRSVKLLSNNEDWVCHSFHSYFLLPGKFNLPISFKVTPLRAGRSFSVWRIDGHQYLNRPLFVMEASFKKMDQQSIQKALSDKGTTDSNFPIHQYPEPETLCSDLSDELRSSTSTSLDNKKRTRLRAALIALRDEWHIFEERPCNPSGMRALLLESQPHPDVHAMWIRPYELTFNPMDLGLQQV